MTETQYRLRLRLDQLLREIEMTRNGHETTDDALDLLARLIETLLEEANDDTQ